MDTEEISHVEEIEKYSPWAWIVGWIFALGIMVTMFVISDGFS